MLLKTEALVLKKIPYGENSAVAHLFTQSHGILSFMFSGVQGKKGKSALLRPGTFLEIVFYFTEKQSLLRTKEVKAVEPYMTEDFLAGNTALICAELIRNTLPDAMPDENLFLAVKTDFSRLFRQGNNDLWFLQRFILKLCEAAGHGLPGNAEVIASGLTNRIHDEETQNILQQLIKQQSPVAERHLRLKVAETLIAYMCEVVFPGKDVRTFRVMLDVLDA